MLTKGGWRDSSAEHGVLVGKPDLRSSLLKRSLINCNVQAPHKPQKLIKAESAFFPNPFMLLLCRFK